MVARDEVFGIVGDTCVGLGTLSVRIVLPLVIVEPYLLFSIPFCGSLALGIEVVVTGEIGTLEVEKR